LVRDFQLKGLLLLVGFQRDVAGIRLLDGLRMFALFQGSFGPMLLVLSEVGGKNLRPVWLSWPLSIGSSLWMLTVRGFVRRFGSWRCSCRRGVEFTCSCVQQPFILWCTESMPVSAESPFV
jgi:hypothetical protein